MNEVPKEQQKNTELKLTCEIQCTISIDSRVCEEAPKTYSKYKIYHTIHRSVCLYLNVCVHLTANKSVCVCVWLLERWQNIWEPIENALHLDSTTTTNEFLPENVNAKNETICFFYFMTVTARVRVCLCISNSNFNFMRISN